MVSKHKEYFLLVASTLLLIFIRIFLCLRDADVPLGVFSPKLAKKMGRVVALNFITSIFNKAVSVCWETMLALIVQIVLKSVCVGSVIAVLCG